jgi:hypothetical protein
MGKDFQVSEMPGLGWAVNFFFSVEEKILSITN